MPVGDGLGGRAAATTYDILTGNDADADRHGIVTPDAGLMNPNHYLAVAIDYLYAHRPNWRAGCRDRQDPRLDSMIDRVADSLGRRLSRCRSGSSGSCPGCSTARSPSAARSPPARRSCAFDGTVWTTDKDGILLCLLAAEILAVTGKTPSQLYAELESAFGDPAYQRVDAPATPAQKAALGKLDGDAITATELAGEPITAKLSHAPGNGAAIGGLKVATEHAWFAARPSGTEDVYKIYAESFRGPEHLAEVQEEASAS